MGEEKNISPLQKKMSGGGDSSVNYVEEMLSKQS
jgi:hypothetical protein